MFFLALDCSLPRPPDIKQSYRNLQDFKEERELNCRHYRPTVYSFFQYVFHFISLKCVSVKLETFFPWTASRLYLALLFLIGYRMLEVIPGVLKKRALR